MFHPSFKGFEPSLPLFFSQLENLLDLKANGTSAA